MAPKPVSGRVVNTSMPRSERPSTTKRRRAPSERPIQFRCIVFTRSGQSQPVEGGEKLVGVLGDPQEPLLEHPPFDEVARALAGPVGEHLLVGEHGLTARAPVDGRLRPIGEAGAKQPRENHLVEAHVVGVVAA